MFKKGEIRREMRLLLKKIIAKYTLSMHMIAIKEVFTAKDASKNQVFHNLSNALRSSKLC